MLTRLLFFLYISVYDWLCGIKLCPSPLLNVPMAVHIGLSLFGSEQGWRQRKLALWSTYHFLYANDNPEYLDVHGSPGTCCAIPIKSVLTPRPSFAAKLAMQCFRGVKQVFRWLVLQSRKGHIHPIIAIMLCTGLNTSNKLFNPWGLIRNMKENSLCGKLSWRGAWSFEFP